jgi:hypothetical protein
MPYPASRQIVVITFVALAAGIPLWLATERSASRAVDAGFWFESVTYSSTRLGGPLSAADIAAVESVARAEIAMAFGGLDIAFSDSRDARYRIRVVERIRDLRTRRRLEIPAESRAVSGLGGQGAVSFSWLAHSALGYAPDDATRSDLLDAIGRGIGRSAVHEFTHLFLPRVPIHDSRDVRSYEYGSAARREQYFGEMRWGLAWPLLEERFRRRAQDEPRWAR